MAQAKSPWTVTSRVNQAGNLAIEIGLNGEPHAEFILQEDGTLDLGTRAKPWEMGKSGWTMPGAPTDFRKFRFGPE